MGCAPRTPPNEEKEKKKKQKGNLEGRYEITRASKDTNFLEKLHQKST